MLFQRNLLFAYRQVNLNIAEVALMNFYKHAPMWLPPVNVTLCVFAEMPPYLREAVETGLFPEFADAPGLLKDRRATFKSFFTGLSKTAPCINCAEVPIPVWRGTEYNNRCTERMIGKMKRVVQNKLMDVSYQQSKTDMSICAYLIGFNLVTI